MKGLIQSILFGGTLASFGEIRMNQLQAIGTHNSYHLAPNPGVIKFYQVFSKEAEAWNYSRESFEVQLSRGVRQIELDVFADPDGGLYAHSGHPRIAEMKKPGTKVLHVPKLDARSRYDSFCGALTALRDWSIKNPRHIPVMVLVELKDAKEVPFGPRPIRFDREQIESLETEVLSVFQPNEIIKPDDVRKGFKTLREAILKRGWPLLKETRGKVFFCLDNEGHHRELYLKGNRTLEERLMFVSVNSDHPAAAFMKRNDPERGFADIQNLVRSGFIVRTRADANLKEARENNQRRAQRALASGAQYISTDFPVADPKISSYEVRLPNKNVARPNPVSGSNIQLHELE